MHAPQERKPPPAAGLTTTDVSLDEGTMISARDDYRVRLCALLSTLLIGSTGCSGKRQPNAAAPAHTTIIAKVKAVAPLASRMNARRHLWRVEMEAVQLVEGTPAVEPGDALAIRVHSVVRTFGHDTSEVIGKQFRLVYAQEFAEDYFGDLEVSTLPD